MHGNEDGPMTDEQLKSLMAEAAHTYRVPADPPLEEIWTRVESEHFGSWRVRRTRRWLAPAVGIAATLLVGIGIGRFTATGAEGLTGIVGRGAATRPVADGAGTSRPPGTLDENGQEVGSRVSDPLQRTTSAYLDDAEMLLASMPREAKGVDSAFVRDAHRLLTTTRVLLDSPVGTDPRLRDMLEDLELILAQVARLQTAPRADELTFIAEAMDERDMVPRIRTVAAALSYSDY